MKKFIVTSSILVTAFAVYFAVFIHQPVPDNYPDRIYFQVLSDLLLIMEQLSKLSEPFVYNRFWPYNLLAIKTSWIPYMTPPPNVTLEVVKLGNIDSVLIIPDKFKDHKKPGPVMVFYHGGGWIFGSPGAYLQVLVKAAQETGFMIMSPDYRLAPEHPFPIPFEDCLQSTIAFIADAAKYNIDPDQVVVSGDSAGGNLALSVALKLMQMKEVGTSSFSPKMVSVAYPVLQMINFRLPSYSTNLAINGEQNGIPKAWLTYLGFYPDISYTEQMVGGVHIDSSILSEDEKNTLHYINVDLISDEFEIETSQRDNIVVESVVDQEMNRKLTQFAFNPLVAPLMASDAVLSKMMRTHIMVANHDQLRDESLILYARLKNLGVDVTVQFLPNSPHACLNAGGIDAASYHGKQNTIFFDQMRAHFENE